MKLKQLIESIMLQTKTVARFGTARLIEAPGGRFQLVGGTAEDRLAAKEWTSLFLHEAILSEREKLSSASSQSATHSDPKRLRADRFTLTSLNPNIYIQNSLPPQSISGL